MAKYFETKKYVFCRAFRRSTPKSSFGARALMATQKLLILDEPSNNLDQKSKQNLYTILEQLNKEKGIAIVMITHDLDHGNLIGDKILSLQNGDYFFGSTAEYIRKVHHE